MRWLEGVTEWIRGAPRLPTEFRGVLAPEEDVLAVAETSEGTVVATHWGLWLPERRRLSWHMISKATWEDGVLTVTETDEVGTAGSAILLRDRAPRRLTVSGAGRLPRVVHERVTGSIRSRNHRQLPGGGAWVVQRKVPGQDGIVLQVRGDPGTDDALVAALASEVDERLRQGRPPGD